MDTISVITPSFNQGPYLEETIRSVLSQEGDFFIDYIIMDGGSTDESLSIIRKYDELLKTGEWNSRCLGIELRWFSERDQGQSHALNKGFKISKGEVVGWINSDDLFCDGAFSAVMEHFRENPADDFVFGDGEVINESGELQWEWLARPYNLSLLKSYHFLWNDFTNYIMQQSTFWRKAVFSNIGLIDESLHYAMDLEFWIRAGSTGQRLAHIPVKLGKFRMISGTKSLTSPTIFWPDMLEIFRRYNGAGKMAPFLSYFFYNIARNNNYDMNLAWDMGMDMLSRWKDLDIDDRLILQKEILKGYKKACIISANRSFMEKGRDIGVLTYKFCLDRFPVLMFHPLSFLFILKNLVGFNMSLWFARMNDKLIFMYRQIRYNYRHLGRAKRGG